MAFNTVPALVEPGQRQLELPAYLTRILPVWQTPTWLYGSMWRQLVRNQPFAIICRDSLVANIISLPWRIVVRDADEADTVDYKDDINYYTRLFENEDGGYEVHTELVCNDGLDLPFGGATELGYENDDPEQRLLWYKNIDGATLFPTYNDDWPVGQQVIEHPGDIVYFPKHAISRMYYTPRPEMRRRGWGMAPPEKIYLALELLVRGDRYYANLFIDTPAAGILDLGDMEKEAAIAWVASWKVLLAGADPFKVPVLYQHTKAATFLPFTRSPAELMFDKGLARYGFICAAGYGITLGDIGETSMLTGNSLAAAIRQERKSEKTGIGYLRKKIVRYRNHMLPLHLRFEFIDRDEELLVAKGRARLANSMALGNLVTNGIITSEDAQQQLLADGLITVPVLKPVPVNPAQPANLNGKQGQPIRNALGDPTPVSGGGMGEVKK